VVGDPPSLRTQGWPVVLVVPLLCALSQMRSGIGTITIGSNPPIAGTTNQDDEWDNQS
jgi:hypothetical protein